MKSLVRFGIPLALTTVALVAAGCGGGAPRKKKDTDEKPTDSAPALEDVGGQLMLDRDLSSYDTTLGKMEYTWDKSAGDSSVSAELGGPGFTGEGWTTRLETVQLANPDAPKGGELVTNLNDWPTTLRMTGKDSNTQFNYMASGLMYMGLLSLDPTDLDFGPALATHWKISDDKTVYTFRINPEARWSDGTEITADDVIESWRLRVDPGILFPSSNATFGKFKEPKALSKYIVEVTVNEESWRNFLYFATSAVWPKKAIEIGGEDYLKKYQFAYPPVSGPYNVNPDDIDTGNSITLTRRADWWAKDNGAYKGLYNLDKIKFKVVTDPGLAFEMLKKGELDYAMVGKAEWWAKDLPEVEAVKRGLLVTRKFFTDEPVGTSGIAINMSRQPLDDVKIRKALQHLYNREMMNEKLYFNEYEMLNSYYQGGVYQNMMNEYVGYDPFAAVKLLEEAGWTEKDNDGIRKKNGKRLSLTLTYRSKLSEEQLVIYQDDAKKAGIDLQLQYLTGATAWENLTTKNYDLMSTAWGALVFPNPESGWKSDLADKKNNNNVTAFKSPKVDALLEKYNTEYDQAKRVEIIQEVDGLIYEQHPYVLAWFGPSQRVAFWNKYGMPKTGSDRFSDSSNLFFSWWVDPAKDAELEKARKDGKATMQRGRLEHRFWQAWNQSEAKRKAAEKKAAEEKAAEESTEDGAAPAGE